MLFRREACSPTRFRMFSKTASWGASWLNLKRLRMPCSWPMVTWCCPVKALCRTIKIWPSHKICRLSVFRAPFPPCSWRCQDCSCSMRYLRLWLKLTMMACSTNVRGWTWPTNLSLAKMQNNCWASVVLWPWPAFSFRCGSSKQERGLPLRTQGPWMKEPRKR